MKYFLDNILYQLIKKHSFLLLLILLIGMALFLYKQYVFGGKLFLFEDFGSDSVRTSLPTYLYFYDWFRTGMPLWSDKIGIGTSILSHGEIMFDPFTYILFIFGKDSIIYLFTYFVISKIVFSGIFFWLFIGKYSKYKLSSYAKLLGAITYAFGGYMIVTGQNYVFATICVYLPLLLLGFEMWFQDGKKLLLILMLVAIALYFYYFFYMTAIFFALYAIFRYFLAYQFRFSHFIKYISTLILFGLLSLGLTAFYWLPSGALTMNNLRVGSIHPSLFNMIIPSWSLLSTAFGRLFSYDIFGGPATYIGYYQDYFQLALYGSLFALIAIPQIFLEKTKRAKNTYISFTVILLILLFIPFSSYVFNGFSVFTYRWAYILQFSFSLFLSLASDNIFHKKIVSYKVLSITLIVLFFIALDVLFFIHSTGTILNNWNKQFFERALKIFSIDFALIVIYIYLIIQFFRTNQKFQKRHIKIVIFILVCTELILFPRHFINDNRITTSPDPVKYHLGYFDYTNNVINYLNSIDNSVYRLDKSYDSVKSEYGLIASDNESMVQNYRGIKSYNSNNQPNYIRFLQDAGVFVIDPKIEPPKGKKPQDITGANLNYINGVGNRYLLQSFLGVKYYLTEPDKTKLQLPPYFHPINRIDNITIYKNEDYLPLGFAFDSYITSTDFNTLTNHKKDLALLSFVVVDDPQNVSGILKKDKLKILKNIRVQSDISNLIKDRRKSSFKIDSYKSDNIIGEIKSTHKEMLLFTIPYDKGWSVFIDSQKNNFLKVDNGLIGVPINTGKHWVRLTFFPPGMKLGIIISLLTGILLLIYQVYNFLK
ncbi:MAG TPA: YfhO family protein [Candidatus Sulfotelmatobacter sp.]|jgi:uncharacterized membrane protein YfhO|nr:YfhO family protein [Candidatus Sulfotelmatobacter sp.]